MFYLYFRAAKELQKLVVAKREADEEPNIKGSNKKHKSHVVQETKSELK